MDRTLELLEEAQRRLLASLATRGTSEEARALSIAHRALASVCPQIPALIEERVPVADAVILTKDTMRAVLAQFAVDILAIQTGELRELHPRQRARR